MRTKGTLDIALFNAMLSTATLEPMITVDPNRVG
jgi:hypothetical protein